MAEAPQELAGPILACCHLPHSRAPNLLIIPKPECPTGGSGFTVRRRAHPIHARLGCPDMRLRRPKSPHLGDPR